MLRKSTQFLQFLASSVSINEGKGLPVAHEIERGKRLYANRFKSPSNPLESVKPLYQPKIGSKPSYYYKLCCQYNTPCAPIQGCRHNGCVILNRDLLTREEHKCILALPKKPLNNEGYYEYQRKQFTPMTARCEELAKPRKEKIMNTWKLYHNVLRPRQKENLIRLLYSGVQVSTINDAIEMAENDKKRDEIAKKRYKKECKKEKMKALREQRHMMKSIALSFFEIMKDFLMGDVISFEGNKSGESISNVIAKKIITSGDYDEEINMGTNDIMTKCVRNVSDKLAYWIQKILEITNFGPLPERKISYPSTEEENESNDEVIRIKSVTASGPSVTILQKSIVPLRYSDQSCVQSKDSYRPNSSAHSSSTLFAQKVHTKVSLKSDYSVHDENSINRDKPKNNSISEVSDNSIPRENSRLKYEYADKFVQTSNHDFADNSVQTSDICMHVQASADNESLFYGNPYNNMASLSSVKSLVEMKPSPYLEFPQLQAKSSECSVHIGSASATKTSVQTEHSAHMSYPTIAKSSVHTERSVHIETCPHGNYLVHAEASAHHSEHAPCSQRPLYVEPSVHAKSLVYAQLTAHAKSLVYAEHTSFTESSSIENAIQAAPSEYLTCPSQENTIHSNSDYVMYEDRSPYDITLEQMNPYMYTNPFIYAESAHMKTLLHDETCAHITTALHETTCNHHEPCVHTKSLYEYEHPSSGYLVLTPVAMESSSHSRMTSYPQNHQYMYANTSGTHANYSVQDLPSQHSQVSVYESPRGEMNMNEYEYERNAPQYIQNQNSYVNGGPQNTELYYQYDEDEARKYWSRHFYRDHGNHYANRWLTRQIW